MYERALEASESMDAMNNVSWKSYSLLLVLISF
jgi:hypothetical protein